MQICHKCNGHGRLPLLEDVIKLKVVEIPSLGNTTICYVCNGKGSIVKKSIVNK